MRKRIVAAVVAVALAAAVPLGAQVPAPSAQVTPYAGYVDFGDMVGGPLGTSIRNAGTAVYGAELTLPLSGPLALVGNVAYSRPRLEAAAPIVGGVGIGRSSVWLFDAGLRLSAPASTRLPFTPFVQAGAGAARQSIEVLGVSSAATDVAYHVGAGADVPLGPRLGLQLMVKDYIGKFDAREATGLDVETRTTHNWALSAGIRVGL